MVSYASIIGTISIFFCMLDINEMTHPLVFPFNARYFIQSIIQDFTNNVYYGTFT